MSFPHNNFLTGATSEADIAVSEILETYFKKDGSIIMTGILNAGDKTVLGVANLELNNQVSGSQPTAGKINIYSKLDKKLYMRNDENDEIDLTATGSGDVTGLGLSTADNLTIFSDGTGKVISDSSISKNNVAQASSNFASNTLLRSDGAIKNIKDSVVSLDNLGVISGLTGLTSSGNINFNTITSLALATTSNSINALDLQSGGGTTATQRILNTTGISADSILIDSTDGGIQLDSSSGVDVATGGFSVSSGSVDFTGSSGLTAAGIIDFNSISSFDLLTTDNSANAFKIACSGGTDVKTKIWNFTGTAADSLAIESFEGGIKIDSRTNMDIECSNGAIGIGNDNNTQSINIGTVGARGITIGNNVAGIELNAGVLGLTIKFAGDKRWELSSAGIGFFASPPIAKPTITGSRSGNVALGDLLTDLASFGLITDSTTEGSGGGGGDLSSNISTSVLNRLALFADTSGKLITQSSLIVADGGALSGITELDVDNLNLNGNTITSTGDLVLTTTADGDLSLVSDGTGEIIVNQLRIDANEISSSILNSDLNLKANGTGEVHIINSQLKVDELHSVTPSGNTETVIINSTGELGSAETNISGSCICISATASANFSGTSWSLLEFDSEQLNTDVSLFSVSLALSEITVLFTGNVYFDYRMNAKETGGSSGGISVIMERDDGGGYINLAVSLCYAANLKDGEGEEGTASGSFATAVTSGWKFRLRKQQRGSNGATMQTIFPCGAVWTATRLEN